MDSPLVSIITPVLNGNKYMEMCVQSVLSQSYPNIEHIILDGGSTDGSTETVSHYRSRFPDRIIHILEADSKPGSGSGEAWGKGLRMAKGDILGWLGSDDMLSGPHAIDVVVAFFLSNPDAFFLHGGCKNINGKGDFLYMHDAREVSLGALVNKENPIACPSAFYKKEVVAKVGQPDSYGNDLDYMIRIAKEFPIHQVDEVLSVFRRHNDSETGNINSYIKVLEDDFHVSRKHGGKLLSAYARQYYKFTLIKKLGLLQLYILYRDYISKGAA